MCNDPPSSDAMHDYMSLLLMYTIAPLHGPMHACMYSRYTRSHDSGAFVRMVSDPS
jgi:hypothetical protein